MAPERWEPQQPQDFTTGVADDQTAALVRSRQQNQFVVVGTYVTAPSARGSDQITVASSNGFSPGSFLQIMTDAGENFFTHIAAIDGNVWTLNANLPASVGSLYGDPIENSILLLTNGGPSGFLILDTAQGILDVDILSPP